MKDKKIEVHGDISCATCCLYTYVRLFTIGYVLVYDLFILFISGGQWLSRITICSDKVYIVMYGCSVNPVSLTSLHHT